MNYLCNAADCALLAAELARLLLEEVPQQVEQVALRATTPSACPSCYSASSYYPASPC